MSGFERSAPIPGSQGPRRSQMVRFNNAPPPESPWRLEVLEAKKQAEAAMRKASQRSRSRSRSRERDRDRLDRERERDRRKGGIASVPPVPSNARKVTEAESKEALTKKIVRAREVGEGWFAAVSAASAAWDSIPESKKALGPKVMEESHPSISSQKRKEDKKKTELDDREKERKAKEDKLRLAKDLEEERQRREEQRFEQDRLEKQWAAEAEAREKRRVEERRKLEEDRRKKELAEKSRRQKLGSAFAVDGDDDEEEAKKREAAMLRKASERKRGNGESSQSSQPIQSPQIALTPSLIPTMALSQDFSAVSTSSSGTTPLGDKDLANKLGFDGALDPAEAFIRLQERKRKGRRAEFGGPPRGCSPWRDGKRGVVTPLAMREMARKP